MSTPAPSTETATAQTAPVVGATRRQRRRAIAASTIGTTLEFYDFVLYATLSGTVFPALFFSGVSSELGLFLSYVTLGIGYLARPIGGVIFGHFGDRVGRRTMLMITLIIMGTASVLIGLLPSAAVLGPAAAVILVFLRLFQGIAVGGEWAGAALLAMESAPVKRRGLAASAVLAGGPLGAVLATLILGAMALLPEEAYTSWGWRVPFLLSAGLVVVGVLLRLGVTESPAFVAAREAGETAKGLPLARVLRTSWRALVLTALVGIVPLFVQVLTQSVGIGYSVGAGNHPTAVLWLFTAASVLQAIAIPLYAHASDRFGRIPTLLIGLVVAGVLFGPVFALLGSTALPVVFAGFVLMTCLVQAPTYGPYGAFANEHYDVAVRYTGGSLSYQIAGGIGGGIAPVLGGAMLAAGGGSVWPLSAVFAGLVVVALVAVILARHLRPAD
ncbi:MFS transporter [Microbacterium sp. RD1]|uniref:MFS transporter n=1 Tax=Microbacterium sp. RD1 TaxID=3457313 RepID=UPI003FA59425